MKNEMNNWRRFTLLEQTEDPTVADFLNTFGTQSPNAAKKIFGKAAKFIISGAVGFGAGALAGSVTAGTGAAAVGTVAAKATEAALSKIFDSLAGKGASEFAKFLVAMSENQVDDGERTGLALYYDLDDEYEELLQGMDSDLANKFQEELFKYFKEAIQGMGSIEDPSTEPLKNHIEVTATAYLKRFLEDQDMSSVGVHVKSSRREEE